MVLCEKRNKMKISWRVWVLVFALAFSSVLILNIPSNYSFLLAVLIISIPFVLTFLKSKTTKTIVIILIFIGALSIGFISFQKGVVITSISPDSPYFEEGLSKGMIINSINGN